jgi:5-oxoprolinase (ATP-hydrolysing)
MIAPIKPPSGIRIAVDRGGTFTDIYASIPTNMWPLPSPSPELIQNVTILPPTSNSPTYQINFKLLSVDPQNYADAPTEGIRRLLSMVRNESVPTSEPIDTTGVTFVRMGTTVATNTLLERKGARFGLVITKGFRDLLEIGNQTRLDLFDLRISNQPKMLYLPEDVIEAEERVTPEGYSFDPSPKSAEALMAAAQANGEQGHVVYGVDRQAVRILRPLEEDKLREDLVQLYEKGVRGIAVMFLHSANYPGEKALS